MVRADVAPRVEVDQREVSRCIGVVERPAQQRHVRPESRIEGPADTGVPHPANLLEALAGVAPRHVIEVAGKNTRSWGRRDFSPGPDQFCISAACVVHERRFGV